MNSSTCSYHNLFRPQSFPTEIENEYIANNMTVDFAFGHKDILEEFIGRHKEFASHYDFLTKLSSLQLKGEVESAKRKSILLTTIMITGRCEADCVICCTDRRYKGAEELSLKEIESIFGQAKELGCKTIYIPGEGEPLLDDNFWHVLELSKKMGFDLILFTNGLTLSNDELAQKQWNLTSEQIVNKLVNYPIYIYHKFWSTDQNFIAEVMQISPQLYNYQPFSVNGRGNTIMIPKGLALLLKYFPIERVGIETVVMNKNFEEIKDLIIPFIQNTKVKSYIEPLIHSGRCLGFDKYDIDPARYAELSPWISRLGCKRLGYKIFVDNAGYISFGIQIPIEIYLPRRKKEFSIRDGNGRVKDVFNLVHSNKLLVNGRYAINGCLCEQISLEIGRHGFSTFLTNG